MNEHEIGRIAAAMNQARPDWPLKQLKTLLADARMVDRPRRDVFVALAWIASEPNSASPYRVLESGPWWRAAGVEGATTRREVLTPAERCGTCSESRDRCERLWMRDHTFEADFRTKRGSEVAEITAAVRAEKRPMRTPDTTKTTSVTSGAGRARVEAAAGGEEGES